MPKLHACIISVDAKRDKAVLLSVAQEFSFGIETLEDGVLFDVSGLEKLMGDADEIARKIDQALRKARVTANVAVAESADSAILLARQNYNGNDVSLDKFSQLPLQELEIDPDTLNIFSDLGLHNVDDLRQVPTNDLIGRYGQTFREIIDLIEQKGCRILTPNVKESSLTWVFDLDFPVEDFEQLIFIANHGLDKLFAQISYSALSTEQLDISLGLRKKEEKTYEIKTSFPTLEKAFWLKLVNLRIALDPPESEIVSVRIVSHFTKPRPDQRGLYSVSRPEPESLLLTVNKLKKLVGEDNVGVPTLVDQRLSEAFSLDPEQLPRGREKIEIKSETLTAAFYYFRPPLPAGVTVENKRLLFIKTSRFSGRVNKYSGVWKKNSYWWNRPWSNQEWDIEVEDSGVYRLCRDGDKWSLIGEYD
ncbi:MAG: hypothetical protein HOP17_12025 [Acidobacteria bacterium]|nr:hypothetical protein [Acidobacteriota bacterium]